MPLTYSSIIEDAGVPPVCKAQRYWAITGAATAALVICAMLGTNAAVQSYSVTSPAVHTTHVATVAPFYGSTRAQTAGVTFGADAVQGAVNDNMPVQYDRDGQVSQWSAVAFIALPMALVSAVFFWNRRREDSQVALLPYSGIRSPALPQPKSSRVTLYGKNKNDNFIDQTFTVIADQLLKFLPTTKREKKAFMYYRDGMSAQGTGDYAEALQNYYEALKLETDPFDRSYILYNIGLIHASNGELDKALEYYYQALERNPNLPSALNNIAVIYHFQGEVAEQEGRLEDSIELFDKAADYWREAIRLAPTNYMEAQNWLQSRGELSPDRPY